MGPPGRTVRTVYCTDEFWRENKQTPWWAHLLTLTGIVQPFELGARTHSIRCKILEARQVFSKNFNDTISREQHKTIFSGLRISKMTLSNQSHFFQSPESQFKNSYQFRLRTSQNHSSPEDDLRQLVSLDPPFRFSKMTFRHHQVPEDDFPGPSPFRLVISRNWPGPGKSSSVIWWHRKMTYGAWPIPACRKPEFATPPSVICWRRKKGLPNSGLWQAGIA